MNADSPDIAARLNAAGLRALGASLVTPELIIFPVRHHSPGCALHIQRMFEEQAPSVVLVEGPRSFTPLLPLLTDAQARMPLAIYTYAVHSVQAGAGERRSAAYYPFCDYSPELVALRAASAAGVPTRFIDLDYAEQSLLEQRAEQVDEEAMSLLDERHYRRSRYLQVLAEQLGCRDHEELWEHLFEATASGRSSGDYITDIAAYCQLSRVDSSEQELKADGTLQREAEMAWHIREAVRRREPGEGPVLAVVGGFHAVVLPELLARDEPRPSLPGMRVSDSSAALIRYSFDRLDRLNGYSAGMTAPAWHQLLWEAQQKQARISPAASLRIRREVGLQLLFDIAVELRECHDFALPMPAVAAAYEQMLRLAALRGRAVPLRDDVLDAIVSCFVKGDADADGMLVRHVAQRWFSGHAMGRVPPGAPTPPLVKDFDYRARRQRLRLDDSQPRRAALDIYRRPEHRLTSRLLHGLNLLAVPFAVRTAGPDFVAGVGLERLQEQWEYSYSAATEAALVEASVYGVTVPLAVANRFSARLDRLHADGQAKDAAAAAAMLAQACVLGLHDHLPRTLDTLRTAIAGDASFESVTKAAGSIGLLWESREPLEARDARGIPVVLQSAYERAIYLGASLRSMQGDGSALVEALGRLRELLISAAGRDLDAALYWDMVGQLHAGHPAAVIRGACAGLLYLAGQLMEGDLGQALAGHLGGLRDPKDAVGYLRGLLATARETAWQQPMVLQSLDALLQQWGEPAFVACLPELRLAFSSMTPKETDRVAEAVAQLHGAANLGRLVDYQLDEAQVQANLALSAVLREVFASDGLDAWWDA
ncbi:DUF5682 family protein [Dyella sp. GSA-30]|uniref:DUF5682 family protein n=1 Tax=Dyella sp. GSA-30 TaxID=2994496 RepID=UPI002490E21A|nr:DUF5682 family protein [Dyella sp. GSA-30]BDU20051.1 hypothetical protein DYGSA30_15080 [Dyella sp. GSA-30]